MLPELLFAREPSLAANRVFCCWVATPDALEPLMYSLRYVPSEGQPSMELVPANGCYFDVEPLTHAALAEFVQPAATFQITLKNVGIVGPQIPPDQTHTIRMRIASVAGEPLYGLVESGWIPFPFMSGDIAFIDRNVVSKIENL